MKKLYAFILFGAAIFAVAACNNELQIEDNTKINGPVYETLSVKVGAETKASLATNASKTAFENGDKIAVWTDAGVFQECVVSNGEITVDIFGGPRSNYAVFYNSATVPTFESSTLKITLPAEYNYADVAGDKNPVPMVAKNAAGVDGDMTFYAVCALARITVPGIPATADKLVVSFNKVVTGEFTVANPGNAPSISAGEGSSTVTINLTPGDDYSGAVINIPVPAGTVTASVEAKAGSTTLETKTSVINSWSATRAKGKKATAAFTPSMYSMVFAPGNLYTEDGTLKIAENYYSHIFAYKAEEFNYLEETYKSNNRTHFNFNELYYLMNTSGVKTMPARADANVNIGTVEDIPMIKSDFGDSKTWRVLSRTEFDYTTSPSKRPGATVNGTTGCLYVKALITGMGGLGTSDETGEAGLAVSADGSTSPTTDFQAGLLLFPDNKIISGSFTLGTKNVYNAKYSTTQIAKGVLDALISAGCVFLPAAGGYSNDGDDLGTFASNPANVGTSCDYQLTSSTSASHRYYLLVTNDNVRTGGTARKKGCFYSVRLVRDLN